MTLKKVGWGFGKAIIDVGIIKDRDGKLRGDIEEDYKQYFDFATPVPKGVGVLTVICLIENTLELIGRRFDV